MRLRFLFASKVSKNAFELVQLLTVLNCPFIFCAVSSLSVYLQLALNIALLVGRNFLFCSKKFIRDTGIQSTAFYTGLKVNVTLETKTPNKLVDQVNNLPPNCC